MKQGYRRTIDFSPSAEAAIREMAEEERITIGKVLRRALSTQNYLRDQSKAGCKILIQDKNKSMHQIFLR